MSVDRAAQLRQLMIDDLNDDEEITTETSRQTRKSSARGPSSSSSSSSSRGPAGSKQLQSQCSRAEAIVDARISMLKAAYRKLPTFDDQKPDPGCAAEVHLYTQYVDPVFIPKGQQRHEQGGPVFRLGLEQAREAHWKLTAPKGFATLKGIPELQQLLAYTAADVVHYAVGNTETGAPGTFDSLHKRPAGLMQGSASHSAVLYDGRSLIGQVAPGLRLCLAAEVATGLMCDSQPPPPDTPEHASALLLFLAAALQQAGQECLLSRGRYPFIWITQQQQQQQEEEQQQQLMRLIAMRQLVDFFASPDPASLLQLLLEAARRTAGQQSSSSSSSGNSNSSSSSSSSVIMQAEGIREHGVQGNVLFAALQVAAFVMQDCPSSSSSSSSSGGGGGGGNVSGDDADTHPDREWWQLLHKLRTGRRQQKQQGDADSADAQAVAEVVKFITGLLDSSFSEASQEQQQQQQQQYDYSADSGAAVVHSGGACAAAAAAAVCPASTAVATAAAAAAAAAAEPPPTLAACVLPAADNDSTAAAAAAAAATTTTAADGCCVAAGAPCHCDACLTTAKRTVPCDKAAWHIAVLTGALALLRLFPRFGDDAAAAAAADADPVSAVLLLTAVEGLYFGVRDELQLIGAVVVSGCRCGRCSAARERPEMSFEEECAAVTLQITSKMLTLLQLAQQLQELPGRHYSSGSSSATTTTTTTTTTSSSSSSVNSSSALIRLAQHERQEQAQRQKELQHVKQFQTAAASLTDRKARGCVSALYSMLRHRQSANTPGAWLTEAFQWLGQQQLSPVDLQQQQQGSTAAVAATAAAGGLTGEGDASLLEVMQGLWRDANTSMQQQAAKNLADALSQQQQQQQQGSDAGSELDIVTELMIRSLGDNFKAFAHPMLQWQKHWLDQALAMTDVACIYDAHDQKRLDNKSKIVRRRAREERLAEKAAQRQQQGAAKLRQQQLQKKMLEGDDSDSCSSSSEGEGEGLTKHRSGTIKQHSSSSSDVSSDEDAAECRECPVCAAEEAAADAAAAAADTAAAASGGGGGVGVGGGGAAALPAANSSSGGGGGASAGLYGRFPVPWSDPFMMRRLLWDLLGRVKPTAQQWFKTHANLCPHRGWESLWHLVVMSLARHIWAPTGAWTAQQQQQMSLLLSRDAAATARYARSLNTAFSWQGATGQTAALLSMHALLALDPHAARVQPRPELLFYTPAGFHAAVSKVLLQCLQFPPAVKQLPIPQAGSAAAGESAGDQQQHQQEGRGCSVQQGDEAADITPHYLQQWSEVMFPAYYVWWHKGLLAYHQQQQQQPQQQQQECVSDQSDRLPLQQQQQLSRPASLAAAAATAAAAMSPPLSPATPQPPPLPGAGALMNGSSGSDGGGGGSSGSSADGAVNMQELYNTPEARLFAIGYAMRQLSSSEQLQRLLSNPPIAWELQVSPQDWFAALTPAAIAGARCAQCSKPLRQEVDQEQLTLFSCDVCCTVCCTSACLELHTAAADCTLDPAAEVALNHRWRVLDLLRPPPVPQQQQQQQQLRVPPAINNVLPSTFSTWLDSCQPYEDQQQQQQQEVDDQRQQQQQPLPLLFKVFSTEKNLRYCPPSMLRANAQGTSTDAVDGAAAISSSSSSSRPYSLLMSSARRGADDITSDDIISALGPGWVVERSNGVTCCRRKSHEPERSAEMASSSPMQQQQQQQLMDVKLLRQLRSLDRLSADAPNLASPEPHCEPHAPGASTPQQQDSGCSSAHKL